MCLTVNYMQWREEEPTIATAVCQRRSWSMDLQHSGSRGGAMLLE